MPTTDNLRVEGEVGLRISKKHAYPLDEFGPPDDVSARVTCLLGVLAFGEDEDAVLSARFCFPWPDNAAFGNGGTLRHGGLNGELVRRIGRGNFYSLGTV